MRERSLAISPEPHVETEPSEVAPVASRLALFGNRHQYCTRELICRVMTPQGPGPCGYCGLPIRPKERPDRRISKRRRRPPAAPTIVPPPAPALSEHEFQRATAGLRWSERTLNAMHAVLVEGQMPQDAANRFKVSVGNIYQIRKRLMQRSGVLGGERLESGLNGNT